MASRPRTAALGLLLAASLAGCVSIPTGGPVRSFAVTQGPDGQSQAFIQCIPQPPQNGSSPSQIVLGFISASACVGDQQRTALEYLTPRFSKHWNPRWSATVYSRGPDVELVGAPRSNPKAKGRQTAVVDVTGVVQAKVQAAGGYAVPSAKAATQGPERFTLVKQAGGQWRIDQAPEKLLLTSYLFSIDYQQRNLYFFDPSRHVLVPDPVYVPLQATPAVLMSNLLGDLISPPQGDWLYHATTTAFPAQARVGEVALGARTATVDLTGKFSKVPASTWPQVSAQLWWTLQGNPAVQSVELVLNGKPWVPPGAQQNAVQGQAQIQYSPPVPAPSGVFYYLDGDGYLVQQGSTQGKPSRIGLIGRGYSQIAVSPLQPGGVRYLAALRGSQGGALYTGVFGAHGLVGKLKKRGTGYSSMSWAPDGDLWTTSSDQVFLLQGNGPGQPAGQPVLVSVLHSVASGSFAAVRVAPDGVRVALIVNGSMSVLYFGAIVRPRGAPASATIIDLSPLSVQSPGSTVFTAVTWYGPDNVITLGQQPAPVLTEYPVNGGTSTVIPVPSDLQSVTASAGYPLIAGVAKSIMMANATLTGAWTQIEYGQDNAQVQGVSPAYPG